MSLFNFRKNSSKKEEVKPDPVSQLKNMDDGQAPVGQSSFDSSSPIPDTSVKNTREPEPDKEPMASMTYEQAQKICDELTRKANNEGLTVQEGKTFEIAMDTLRVNANQLSRDIRIGSHPGAPSVTQVAINEYSGFHSQEATATPKIVWNRPIAIEKVAEMFDKYYKENKKRGAKMNDKSEYGMLYQFWNHVLSGKSQVYDNGIFSNKIVTPTDFRIHCYTIATESTDLLVATYFGNIVGINYTPDYIRPIVEKNIEFKNPLAREYALNAFALNAGSYFITSIKQGDSNTTEWLTELCEDPGFSDCLVKNLSDIGQPENKEPIMMQLEFKAKDSVYHLTQGFLSGTKTAAAKTGMISGYSSMISSSVIFESSPYKSGNKLAKKTLESIAKGERKLGISEGRQRENQQNAERELRTI